MPASPICEVKDGVGLWVPTTDGVNVTPGNTISIHLVDTTDVTEWYLRVFGTDDLTPAPPTLTDVNPLTHKVTTPAATVTFPAAVTQGHALAFESIIVTPSQTISTTFGVYELAANGLRVGSVGETREGSMDFGWAKTFNEAIRSGFTAGGDLSGTSTSQTVVGIQGRDVAAAAPADGNALVWNAANSRWQPGPGGGGGSITLGGDLGDWDPASADKQQVVGIYGMPVAPAVEADVGKVLQVIESVWFEEVSSMLWDDPYIWVGNGETNPNPSYITRFNPSTLEADVVVLAGTTGAGCIDLAQDATHVFVATYWDNKILIVDKATLAVVGSFVHPSNRRMWGVAVSGDQVYASDAWNGGLFEFSKSQALSVYPAAATLLQTVTLYGAYGLLVAYGYLWCTDSDSSALHKFNLDLTLVGTYTHPAWAYLADIHAAFGAIWVNSDWDTLILRFDDPGNASAPALAAAINIGTASGNWLTADGNYLYSCGWSPGQRVYQIDPVSNTLTRTLETDSTSDGVGAIAFDGSVLWAGMYNAATPAAEALGFFELSTYTWDGVRYKGARSLQYTSGGGESTRYTSGSLIYVSNDETVTVFGGSFVTKICYLPTPLADGERHTITDATGFGYYYQIIVRNSGGTQLGRIATNFGSLTFVWSVPRGLWVIV